MNNATPAVAPLSADEMDKQRVMFEAEERNNSSNLKRRDDGQYENPCTQSAWEGWQNALIAQARAAQPDPLREAVKAITLLLNEGEWADLLHADGDAVALWDAVDRLLAKNGAAPAAQVASVEDARAIAHVPGWERGIATVTLTGHQLREALDFINPDGDDEPDQREDELTFGIVQHKDDDGNVSTGLCCWNGDSDGVLPLDGATQEGK